MLEAEIRLLVIEVDAEVCGSIQNGGKFGDVSVIDELLYLHSG